MTDSRCRRSTGGGRARRPMVGLLRMVSEWAALHHPVRTGNTSRGRLRAAVGGWRRRSVTARAAVRGIVSSSTRPPFPAGRRHHRDQFELNSASRRTACRCWSPAPSYASRASRRPRISRRWRPSPPGAVSVKTSRPEPRAGGVVTPLCAKSWKATISAPAATIAGRGTCWLAIAGGRCAASHHRRAAAVVISPDRRRRRRWRCVRFPGFTGRNRGFIASRQRAQCGRQQSRRRAAELLEPRLPASYSSAPTSR